MTEEISTPNKAEVVETEEEKQTRLEDETRLEEERVAGLSEEEKAEEEKKAADKLAADKLAKKVNPTKKYIDQLRGDKFTVLNENAQLKKQLREATLPAAVKEIEATRPTRPDMAGFEDEFGKVDHKKYNEAVTDYEDKLFTWRENARIQQEDADDEVDRVEGARTNFKKQISKISEKYEDFSEVALVDGVIDSDAVAQHVMESPYGAEIAYYLGKNLDYALELNKLSSNEVLKEVGKLEARFSAIPDKRNISEATEPITPVGTNDAGIIIDPSKIEDDDKWYEWYKKNEAKKIKV